MRLRSLAVSLSFLAAANVHAQGRAIQPKATGEVRIDYTEETLPNGLHVIYHVDRTTPVAAVLLWYNVGSKVEAPGKTGFAHLFEHMMFQGSKNVSKTGHFSLLEAAGGRGGSDINGTTSNDRTNYFEQLPSNQVELALWLEADRMGTLTETLTQEKLDNQREVVKNERRQSLDNQPYGTRFERLEEALYPAGHPYHHDVIGSMADLSAATREDVTGFFKTYYAPNNAVLVVAGDIDVPQVKSLVRKYFAPIPRGPAVPGLANMTLPPIVGVEHREVVNDSLAVAPAIYIGFRVPAATDARAAQVSLLGDVIGSGKSSRLYEALVRTQKATQAFSFNWGMSTGADMLILGAVGAPGSSADSLEKALMTQLASMNGNFTQAELDRAKAAERFAFVNGLQTTGGFGGQADRLAEGWTFFHDPNHVNKYLPEINAVTLAQLNALARERLVPVNRATIVFVPARKSPSAPRTK
ncbi:MAG: insulinase family protein [Gemmatimonadaceae bacterium]|nr:insulinase family protein [Gemmatimonadaceae bacterium]